MTSQHERAEEHEKLHHIRIHRQCGACGFLFSVDNPLVAVCASPAGYIALNALKFSAIGTPQTRDGRVFCRHPRCQSCSATKEETATVHLDCFNLYIVRTKLQRDKLRRLWAFSLARYPWPRNPALLLPSQPDATRANNLAKDIYNLNGLTRLPNEIITMIWGLLAQHALLRLSCVLETVDFLSHADLHKPLSIPLRQVYSWQRGTNPVISTTVPSSPIELTIDSRGIKSIQRSGRYCIGSQPPFIVFTTIGVDHDLTVEFQFGVSRLAPIPRPLHLQITDSPNISLSAAVRFPSPKHDVRRAVSLDRCSGITFFLLKRNLYTIHVHTHATPTADITFAQIEPTVQPFLSWFYVPNPLADKISAFGVQIGTSPSGKLQLKRRSYLVRTPHRGDFYIGPPPIEPGTDFMVHTPARSTLLFTIAENHFACISSVLTEGSFCSAATSPAPEKPPLPDTCYASAKLKDAKSVWIFRDEQNEYCRGLIVEYLDGTEGALGFCRIGVDRAERCAAVERLSFKAAGGKDMSTASTVMVRASETSIGGGRDGWTHFSEGDTVEVWASAAEMVMKIGQ